MKQLYDLVYGQAEDLQDFGSVRTKRQTSSINCTALEIQLLQAQNEIKSNQAKIKNATITMQTIKAQLDIYQARVTANVEGPDLKRALALLPTYQRLYNSTVITINTLNQRLIDFQTQEAKTKNDIDTYCKPPLSLDPCGELAKF